MFILALTTGLFGGFGHCIGMCGPLVASYTINGAGGPGNVPLQRMPALKTHLIYNAGRITTYTFIGSLMGLTGAFVNTTGRLAGVQNLVPVFAGFFMIVSGLRIAGVLKAPLFPELKNTMLIRAMKFVLEGESSWKYYPLGILLGFMPCGLSYSVFIGAAAAGGFFRGMLLLLLFGVGTVPALLFFGTFVGYLGSKARGRLYAAGGIAVILMGLFFLSRGLSGYS